jgi:hypothetical protein
MDQSLGQERVAGESWTVVAPERVLEMFKQFVLLHRAEVVCACLLLLMATNLFASISRKSITNDEIVHIPAGYYHLVAGQFQLNNEHPPIVKMWAALPLLFIQPDEGQPKTSQQRGNFSQETWKYLQHFWPENKDRAPTIYFWTRAMMVALTLALGVLIFSYARLLFGVGAAVFSVLIYSLEPTVLAHGRIVHTDLPAALTFLLFFFVLQLYLRKRSLRRALLLGLVTGLSLVTKFSMIVLLPTLMGVALVGFIFASRWNESRRKIALHTGLAVCIILVVLNAAYHFNSPPVEPEDIKWVQARSPSTFENWMTFFETGSKIVPTYYLFGQYNVWIHNRDGHATSLLGQHNFLGWWYYFPVAFALKTSLPILIMSLLGFGWGVWRLVKEKDKRWLWLVIPFVIYSAMSMSSHINIGVRHFLPAYSFLFIAGGALLDRLIRVGYQRQLARVLVIVLLAWTSIEAFRVFPDYVPYMNQLASRHPHWWYLSDSNVEWGDDIGELAAYLKARGERQVSAAFIGGWSILGSYDVEYVDMFAPGVAEHLPTRYVAVGASYLNGSTVLPGEPGTGRDTTDGRLNFFKEYRTREPEAVFGGSIYLYRVDQ